MPRRAVVVASLLAVVLSLLTPSQAAWLTSAVGWGAAASTSVGPGTVPAPTVAGRTVTLSWAAVVLASGLPVEGYRVRRYDAGTTVQRPIEAGTCAGLVGGLSCTHTSAPAGTWRYTVTPVRGSWSGAQSPAGLVTVAGPSLSLGAAAAVRPGAVLSGSASGFVAGESVSYRLDAAAGPLLSGTLAGATTPTAVPAGGGGAVTVTVPAGTADGLHDVVAVAAPSGELAATSFVVDGTAPPAPVFTRTPANPSGDSATFEFTQADGSASMTCRLDGGADSPCSSPVELTGLAAGAHTFAVRATDPAGNTGTAVTFSWTVSVDVPNVAIIFPAAGARLNDAGYTAGCAPTSAAVCGTADDEVDGISAVAVSLRRTGTGQYWTGTGFTGGTETFLAASGTDAWSYAVPAEALPEGDYQLRARATDGKTPVGTVGYDTRSFTIDRTAPPVPTFTTAPAATTGPSVSVAYSTAEPGAGFECRLDAGIFSACSTPQTLAGLGDGTHVLAVRARDTAGNASASTSVTWTVDAVAPVVTTTHPQPAQLSPQAWTAGCSTPAVGDVCGSSTDTGSGTSSVSLSVRSVASGTYYGGSAFDAPTETWLPATGTTAWSAPLAAASLPDGTYVLRVRASDAVGNTATVSVAFGLDGTPPAPPELLGAPASPGGSTAFFDVDVAETGAVLQCRLDGGAWTACASPVTYAKLAAGPHEAEFRAVDAAGNQSTVTRYAWIVDPDLPTVQLLSPSAGRSYGDAAFDAACGTPAGDVCGTATDPQGLDRVELAIRRDATGLHWDGSAFSAPQQTWLPATGTTSWSTAFPAASFPAEGAYTLVARATDVGGGTATDVVVLHVDRTPPAAPTITGGPSGTTNGADTFTFSGDATAAFECRRDGGAWTSCSSPSTATSSNGPHVFEVRAVDGAGNRSAAASRSWTVDTVAPVVTVAFAADGGRYNDAGYTAGCAGAGAGDVCGLASDAVSSVALVQVSLRRTSTGLYWTGTGFTASAPVWLTATGTTSWTLPLTATAFPADDTYTVSARASDAPGNLSAPVVNTFVVDRAAPTATGIAAVNRGAIARKIETGDQLVLTFSEAVAPSTLIAGWNGVGSRLVTIRQTNGTQDTLTFWNDVNNALLPLGDVRLRAGTYVNANVVHGGPGTTTRSTLALVGGVVTLTFGTPVAVGSVTTASGAAVNMTWRPRQTVPTGAGVTDLAGNLGSTTARSETDLDNDF